MLGDARIVTPPCYIILGRYGDIIQCLPMFKAMVHPVVITSEEYGDIFEGVSYVEHIKILEDWQTGVAAAKAKARQYGLTPVVVQFWGDEPYYWDRKYSEVHSAKMAKYPDYGTSMWNLCGFEREQMLSLPLVFDRRDKEREAQLVEQVRVIGKYLTVRKSIPLLLVNFTGKSSPFAAMPEVHREIMKFAHKFNIVDIGALKCHRIYDLLGLYDVAAGLITIDTATLHLAPASHVPYMAFTQDGWSGSVPKGNCVKEIKYSQAIVRLGEIGPVLEGWAK